MGSYAGKNEHDPEGGLIMPTVVGIRFKKAGKIYYFDPEKTGVQKDDFAIVETARAWSTAKLLPA